MFDWGDFECSKIVATSALNAAASPGTKCLHANSVETINSSIGILFGEIAKPAPLASNVV